MGQNYSDDQWQTWHEGPPRRDNRWLMTLGIGMAALCLLAVCGAGGWYVLRPLLQAPTRIAPPPIPTVLGGEQTATAVAAGGPTATVPAVGEQTATAITAGTETAVPPTGTPAATPTPVTPTPTPQPDFVARRASGGRTIDGDLGDWEAGPTIASAFLVFSRAGWDGSADLEAVWRVGWDENNLYLAVEVQDDIHVQTQTGNQIFRGDSVDVQIDTNPAARAARVNPATFQIILSPGNFADLPPSAFRFQGTSDGRIVDATGHNIQVAATQRSGGYVLEAAIPWHNLNFSPDQGDVLGIALNANDNDRPGEAVQEVMMSTSPTRTLTDPRTWGTMGLE